MYSFSVIYNSSFVSVTLAYYRIFRNVRKILIVAIGIFFHRETPLKQLVSILSYDLKIFPNSRVGEPSVL